MFEFPTVCRFCTKTADLIYDLDDNNPSLVEKLAALAPDTLEFNEILPQKICQSCYDKLNESYSFQQQILLAHKLYKSFMEYQENLENAQGENIAVENVEKIEPFEYVEEDFISEDLRHFINNLGNCTAQVNETFIRCRNNNLPEVKINSKRNAARKPPETVVKRKRGRPRKYCGLLQFKNDDLTDVRKMKNAVVNSLPNIDPDYEPPRYYTQQPVTINLRKKRGRPRSTASFEEKEAKRSINETYIITEEIQQVYEIPVIDAIEAGPSITQEQVQVQEQELVQEEEIVQEIVQEQELVQEQEQEPGLELEPDPEPPEVCEFAAKSQEYLNRHMVRHDESDENKIECTICKKLLKSRHSFKIHMKRHKDERSLETPYWRKTF